mgnify:CR=1 FL=1
MLWKWLNQKQNTIKRDIEWNKRLNFQHSKDEGIWRWGTKGTQFEEDKNMTGMLIMYDPWMTEKKLWQMRDRCNRFRWEGEIVAQQWHYKLYMHTSACHTQSYSAGVTYCHNINKNGQDILDVLFSERYVMTAWAYIIYFFVL